MAITQMQPTDARKLVPCFDEPEFKAIWNVTVIHPQGTSALSNGIELNSAKYRLGPVFLNFNTFIVKKAFCASHVVFMLVFFFI